MTQAPPDNNEEQEGFLSRFTVLFSAPRELWLVYFGKVMETIAYALFNMGLMLHLINDLLISDQNAGWFVGVWAMIFTLSTFLVGSLSDALGIRKTLVYSFAMCIVFRVFSAILDHPVLTPWIGMIPLAFASAMTLPVMVAGTRRFSNKKQSSMAFALLYVFMNVGFAIAGLLYDWVRELMGKGGVFEILGMELSVYQTIFLLAAAFTLVGLIPIFFGIREGAEMPDEGDEIIITPPEEKPAGGALGSMTAVLKKTANILKEVFREPDFYRFLLFLALVVGVRLVFYHMHYTLPPYSDREIGYGSRFGTAWGVLNPLMIIILTPLVGAFAQKISSYRMIVIGTSICSLSCFLLVLPHDAFIMLDGTPMRDFLRWFLRIDGDLAPLYYNIVIFSFLFSIGEAIWSPRLYEYTASVAPKGRESTYMGLSMLPLFFGKLLAGPLSGILLSSFCPSEGTRDSTKLWLVVTVMALVTPFAVLLLKNVIKPRRVETEEAAS